MGCITSLQLDNITLDCADIPTGGVKEIYIANACDTVLGFMEDPTDPLYGQVTTLAFDSGEVFRLDFNKKDGATGWNEAKTVDNSGLVTNVPNLVIEFPKMTNAKRNMINDILNPNVKVLLFVRTAADTYHVLGAKFGMNASEGSGDSGSGRTEKNAFTLTFVGEESELSYDLATKWANVIAKTPPVLLGEGDWRADLLTGITVPRQSCIPDPV